VSKKLRHQSGGIESIQSKLKAAEERRTALNEHKVTRARSNSEGNRVLKVITANLQRLTAQHNIETKRKAAEERRAISLANKQQKARRPIDEKRGKRALAEQEEDAHNKMRAALFEQQEREAGTRRAMIESQRKKKALAHFARVEFKRERVQVTLVSLSPSRVTCIWTSIHDA